jgi:hypothetical protein
MPAHDDDERCDCDDCQNGAVVLRLDDEDDYVRLEWLACTGWCAEA